MIRPLSRLACAALLALYAGSFVPAAAQLASDTAPAASRDVTPVVARHGMVVAQEARAARVGVDILQRGGNAVDAAVATGFAMAVTYPRAGNIGGGGYMVIHLADRGIATAIDYRETAPAAVNRNTFLDEHGEADPRKSRDSALAIGVPGTVAGLALAHARYGSGRLTLAELIAPAIALAREGIPIEDDIADSLPRSAAAAGALAVDREDLPRRRRAPARARRPCSPGRPRRHARRHRSGGTHRVL